MGIIKQTSLFFFFSFTELIELRSYWSQTQTYYLNKQGDAIETVQPVDERNILLHLMTISVPRSMYSVQIPRAAIYNPFSHLGSRNRVMIILYLTPRYF